MALGLYILKGHDPVPCEDIVKWGEWFERASRKVASTYVGKVHVSTVFLGIDHAFGSGGPVLFETMIFGGKYAFFQERYRTWGEAEEGHMRAVEMVEEVKV